MSPTRKHRVFGRSSGRLLRDVLVPALVAGLGFGCSASSPPKGMAAGGSSNAGGSGSGGVGPGPVVETQCTPHLPQRLVLLSDYQASNGIRTLLGDAALDEHAPNAEQKPFTQKGFVVSTAMFQTRLGWSERAASSLDGRFDQVTGCPTTGDDACAQTFLEQFGKRAFRRPLQPQEVTDLMAVFAVGKQLSFEMGVKLAVEAVLASPSYSARTEYGAPNVEGQLVLTPHELASELSFLFTDTVPDADLLAAADSGALSTPAVLEQHLQRLITVPAAQASLTKTLMAAWDIQAVFGASKDPGQFPEYTPILQASMYKETELFVTDKLWGAAPVSELLTSSSTFVNGALATLYGVPHTGATPSDFVSVTLPAGTRAGLLTQPSMLATRAGSDVTSVVARGLFVRGALLCLPKIPPPPEAVKAQVEEQVKLAATMTQQELAAKRASTDPCRSCHSQFDPAGLLLENYDPIGRYRTELKGAPITVSVDLAGFGAIQGNFTGAVAFAQAAAASPVFTSCLVQQLMTYGTRDEELTSDSCDVGEAMTKLPAAGVTFKDIVKQVGLSPALRLRTQEAAL